MLISTCKLNRTKPSSKCHGICFFFFIKTWKNLVFIRSNWVWCCYIMRLLSYIKSNIVAVVFVIINIVVVIIMVVVVIVTGALCVLSLLSLLNVNVNDERIWLLIWIDNMIYFCDAIGMRTFESHILLMIAWCLIGQKIRLWREYIYMYVHSVKVMPNIYHFHLQAFKSRLKLQFDGLSLVERSTWMKC